MATTQSYIVALEIAEEELGSEATIQDKSVTIGEEVERLDTLSPKSEESTWARFTRVIIDRSENAIELWSQQPDGGRGELLVKVIR